MCSDYCSTAGIDITANRLFGPQPRTATYICIWEINLGRVKALLSASDGRLLAAAGSAFRLNYADLVNAPANEYLPAVEPDGQLPNMMLLRYLTIIIATFVRLSVVGLDITWQAGCASLTISLPLGISVDNNDLGGRYHRKVTSIQIPEICVKTLLTASKEGSDWLEAAEITADAFLDIYTSPRGYHAMAQAQIAYIEEQDQLTGRAKQMFGPLGSQKTTPSSSMTSLITIIHIYY